MTPRWRPPGRPSAGGGRTVIIDPWLLRRTLGTFPTGVTVVTTGGMSPHGMTANSFTSVSLDPPLVLVCVDREAVMHAALTAAGTFAVSMLAAHQEAVARHFADRRRSLGMAQFEPIGWAPGERTGAPLIRNAAAHIECELWRTYDGGDHSVFVGIVLWLHRQAEADPLLFLNGRFRQVEPAGELQDG